MLKYVLSLAMMFLLSCDKEKSSINLSSPEDNPIVANSSGIDYEDIEERGKLKALVVYSSTSYFLYRGQPMGFEYEILNRLAKDLNLELELIVSDDLDSQFEVLNRGDVDIIAHGMTITNQRKWEVDFTEYLYLTKQVLVQKKPDNYRRLSWSSLQKSLVKDPIQLLDDTISIRKNSSYVERVISLANEMGGTIHIDTLSSQLSTGEIIEMVANGDIKYTIADENLARINASYRPILDVSVPISFTQRIGWVTRKKSDSLRHIIDEWIRKERKTTDYKVIYNKYFKNKRSFKRRTKSDYYSLNNKQISQYDELIKTYAKEIGWDWRLLASLIYQESKFNPKSESWAGAVGLMQMMPSTAMDLELKNPLEPEQNLQGGTTYLKQIYDKFENIEDHTERIKFTLAAYNCGYAHILDAIRLAKRNDLNPNIWNNHVEKMILRLSSPKYYNQPFIRYGYVRGSEPVKYVSEIFERYEHYKKFFD